MRDRFDGPTFQIESAILTSSTGSSVDIFQVVMEYEAFEDITMPYCTGTVLVVDQTGWFEEFKFRGTERLVMNIKDNVGDQTWTKKWHVHSAERVEKSGVGDAKSTVWLLSLIDEHATASKATKFSEAIGNGTKLEDEIVNILSSKIGKSCKKVTGGQQSIQENWKAIVPYMHPLEACEWLRDRASTNKGMPFLLFGSVFNDELKLATLDALLEIPPFNMEDPYVYSGAETQADVITKSFRKRHKQIHDVSISKLSDTFNHILTGTIGSSYAMTELDDATIKGWVPKHLSVTDVVDAIPSDNGGSENTYDPNFSLQGVGPAHTADSRFVHQVLNRKTYRPGTNYKSIHWEPDADKHHHKIKTQAALNLMMKNSYEITVTGADIIAAKAGVGDRIDVRIPEDGDEKKTVPAKLLSGDFIITNIHHQLQTAGGNGKHMTTLNISKFNYGNKVFTND